MIAGAFQGADPGVEAALPLAELYNPRTPANGTVTAESRFLSVSQGDPLVDADVVVVMVMMVPASGPAQ